MSPAGGSNGTPLSQVFFTVVADEARMLASRTQQTAQASEELARLAAEQQALMAVFKT